MSTRAHTALEQLPAERRIPPVVQAASTPKDKERKRKAMALRNASISTATNNNNYLDAALEAVEARLGLPTPPPVKRHVGFSGAGDDEEEEWTPTEYEFFLSLSLFFRFAGHLSLASIRLLRPQKVREFLMHMRRWSWERLFLRFCEFEKEKQGKEGEKRNTFLFRSSKRKLAMTTTTSFSSHLFFSSLLPPQKLLSRSR